RLRVRRAIRLPIYLTRRSRSRERARGARPRLIAARQTAVVRRVVGGCPLPGRVRSATESRRFISASETLRRSAPLATSSETTVSTVSRTAGVIPWVWEPLGRFISDDFLLIRRSKDVANGVGRRSRDET